MPSSCTEDAELASCGRLDVTSRRRLLRAMPSVRESSYPSAWASGLVWIRPPAARTALCAQQQDGYAVGGDELRRPHCRRGVPLCSSSSAWGSFDPGSNFFVGHETVWLCQR